MYTCLLEDKTVVDKHLEWDDFFYKFLINFEELLSDFENIWWLRVQLL